MSYYDDCKEAMRRNRILTYTPRYPGRTLEHTQIEFNGSYRDAVLIEGYPVILRPNMEYPVLSDIPEPLRIRLQTYRQWRDQGYKPKSGTKWIDIVANLRAPRRTFGYYLDTDVEFTGEVE